MAQYFFDIIADGELVSDEEGMILPDFDAARREAHWRGWRVLSVIQKTFQS